MDKDLILQAIALLQRALVDTFYHAPTDRLVRPRPSPPALGPAGFEFPDPSFGSLMCRMTDALTDSGQPFRVPSNAGASAWSCDSKQFLLMNGGGSAKVFDFDGKKATPTNLLAGTGNVEPMFSYVDPQMIWGCWNHVISTWKNSVRTAVVDLEVLYPSLAWTGTYMGGLHVVDNDIWITYFGGYAQDGHTYLHHSKAGFLSTIPLGFKIHAAGLDRTGRYAFIFPRQQDIAAVGQVIIWDTMLGSVKALPVLTGGHGVLGYGTYINQVGFTATTNDNLQWQIRDIANPSVTKELIQSLTPKEVSISDHTNWRPCSPTALVPMISSTFRYGAGLDTTTTPWRACDDEIIAVATDGSGVINRFCHHQSVIGTDFWDQPIVNVDPSGRFALFTSNWGKTVGLGRQDVFLVHLT